MAMTYGKCGACGGSGRVNNKVCPRCGGIGKVRVPLTAPKVIKERMKKKGLFHRLAPMSPSEGPPLPSGANVHWPRVPEKLKKGVTFVPEVRIPTPFGGISLPRYGLPPMKKPRLDGERKKALIQGLGVDLTFIPALVPVVGDTLASALEDMHRAEVRKHLTPEEYDRFVQETKVAPDTVALVRTFLEKG